MPDPWSYAKSSEHSHQTALFMWANIASRWGIQAADRVESYTKPGFLRQYYWWGDSLQDAAYPNHGPAAVLQLKWLHAIHNQGRDPGQAGKIRGSIARAEGVKAGVSDVFLPVPALTQGSAYPAAGYPYHCGFYLELKIGSNTPSEIQLEFMADMRSAGYAADWAVGWLEAREKILAYLQISA